MAEPTLTHALRVPGQLYLGCSSVSSVAPPFGGTQLGLLEQIAVRRQYKRVQLSYECFGQGQPVEQLGIGAVYTIGAILLNADQDALEAIHGGETSQDSWDRMVIDGPAELGPRSPRAVSILFAPDDLDRHQMVLFPRALPWAGEGLHEINLSLAEDAAVAMVFTAIPQVDGTVPYRIFRHGALAGDGTGAVV